MTMEEMWQDYFADQFHEEDPWAYETSQYEQDKYRRQIRVVDDHCSDVGRILEIGCAEGIHSEMLLDAFPAAELVGVDLSERAIERASDRLDMDRASLFAEDAVEFVPELEGGFDAIVWSESIAFIGDSMSLPKLFRYIRSVMALLAPGGVIVLANMVDYDGTTGGLSHPAVLGAYRDLFSSFGESVHRSHHTEYKAEEDEEMSYEIWAFQVPSDA